jgi:SAM-dependent methyltransferase
MSSPSDSPSGDKTTLFFEVHRDLPREGPGDTASTHRALRLIDPSLATGRIVDVGCGPGAQTIDLANVASGSITALDNHQPYLERLRDRIHAAGLTGRVRAIRASMLDMPFADGTVDIVWAEGAIYIAGFERGLRDWRPLLRPGGCVAVTHLSWLSAYVPNEPKMFWERHYPAMRTVDDNLRGARQSGFEVVEWFVLPESAWWTDYYRPMEARLRTLRDRYQHDDEALEVIASSQQQIDLYRRFPQSYGYVFYVLRRV